MYYALESRFFSQLFFLFFSCRTASGGAQGAAANGAVEGQKPSGPPSVRHNTIGKTSFWRNIFVCMSLSSHDLVHQLPTRLKELEEFLMKMQELKNLEYSFRKKFISLWVFSQNFFSSYIYFFSKLSYAQNFYLLKIRLNLFEISNTVLEFENLI